MEGRDIYVHLSIYIALTGLKKIRNHNQAGEMFISKIIRFFLPQEENI